MRLVIKDNYGTNIGVAEVEWQPGSEELVANLPNLFPGLVSVPLPIWGHPALAWVIEVRNDG